MKPKLNRAGKQELKESEHKPDIYNIWNEISVWLIHRFMVVLSYDKNTAFVTSKEIALMDKIVFQILIFWSKAASLHN